MDDTQAALRRSTERVRDWIGGNCEGETPRVHIALLATFCEQLASATAPAGEPVAWMTRTEEGDPSMLFFDRAEAVQYCDDGEQPTPLYEACHAGTPSVDAEALIAAAVPGGSVCDPQQVADEIRRYLNQWPADTPSSYLGKPDNSPAVALGSLHAVASRLRLSGVDDDVAASLAQQIADAAAALNAVTPRPDQPLAVVSSEGLGPSAQPVERDLHRGGYSYEASMLRNLLARIHRDGGHYVEQHGLDKALEDAEAKVVQWIAAVEGADKPSEPEPAAWIEHHKAGDNLLWDSPGDARRRTALYAEHDVNVLKVRAFALESAAGHLGALVEELDEMVGWSYSQLHRMNYSKQEDALMLDSMKLRLLNRPHGA